MEMGKNDDVLNFLLSLYSFEKMKHRDIDVI